MFQFGNLKFCWKLGIGNWKLNLAFGIFLLDRILKGYAQHLPAGSVFSFFPGLQFKYSLNPSLFFFSSWSFIPWLALTVLLILIILFVVNFQKQVASGYWLVAIGSIILGGGSNVFDRFLYGGVIDYVEISGLARINLADILILLGILFLLRASTRSHALSTTRQESGIRN